MVKGLKRDYTEFGDESIVNSLRGLTIGKYNAKLSLQQAEETHDLAKETLKLKQSDLKSIQEQIRLDTDFKAQGITNKEGREAYISKQENVKKAVEVVNESEKIVKKSRKDMQFYENEYNLISDELSNYRLFIRLEISRRQRATETILFEPPLTPEDLDKLFEEWDKMVKNEPVPWGTGDKDAVKGEE